MNDRNKAIAITKTFIENNPHYSGYSVDTDKVVEYDSLWYVPFSPTSKSKEINVGTYLGLIVDKISSDYMQPGSGLPLEKWIEGFKIGLRGKRRIPRTFSRNKIIERLKNTPCCFKNQGFTFSVDQFKEIESKKLFDYELIPTTNEDSSLLGELIK